MRLSFSISLIGLKSTFVCCFHLYTWFYISPHPQHFFSHLNKEWRQSLHVCRMLPINKIKCQGKQQSVYHLILGCHFQKDQTLSFQHYPWKMNEPHCLVDYLWQRPINQSTGGSSWTPRITLKAGGLNSFLCIWYRTVIYTLFHLL